MLTAMSLHFILIVLKQINAVVVVIILTIHLQNNAFLMLLKNINIKVFNLMLRTNETRHIGWHKAFKFKC